MTSTGFTPRLIKIGQDVWFRGEKALVIGTNRPLGTYEKYIIKVCSSGAIFEATRIQLESKCPEELDDELDSLLRSLQGDESEISPNATASLSVPQNEAILLNQGTTFRPVESSVLDSSESAVTLDPTHTITIIW